MNRTEFLEKLDWAMSIEINETPNYKTMLHIAKHRNRCFPRHCAVNIKIDVSDAFIDDRDLFNRTVDGYVFILNRLWKTLSLDFPAVGEAEKMFDEMTKEMTLNYI